MLSDPDRKTAKAYGLVADDKGFPKRWTVYVSVEGKIALIDKDVKPAAHGDAVVKKLNDLGVAKAEKK